MTIEDWKTLNTNRIKDINNQLNMLSKIISKRHYNISNSDDYINIINYYSNIYNELYNVDTYIRNIIKRVDNY